MNTDSPGERLRQAIEEEKPLQIAGAVNAYCALLAERSGFKALYLSGAGVANSSHGLPDLAVTTLHDVVADAARITAITDLPLLVDIDTGWGNSLMVQRAIATLEQVGVAGAHIEDQVASKRCGHRPNKELVSVEEMCARIEAACRGRRNPSFVIMARTDALASEGFEAAVDRCRCYRDAGADLLFPEAFTDLEQYRQLKHEVGLPILANITEFGKTPLFTTEQLAAADVDIALYPLSASRAMYRAAEKVYSTIRESGSQQRVVDMMQTRDELYEVLGYQELEKKLDKKEFKG